MEKVVMPTPPPPPSALCCPLKSKPCCCYSEEETCRQMALDCFCSAFEQLFETINSSSISSEIIDFAFWDRYVHQVVWVQEISSHSPSD